MSSSPGWRDWRISTGAQVMQGDDGVGDLYLPLMYGAAHFLQPYHFSENSLASFQYLTDLVNAEHSG